MSKITLTEAVAPSTPATDKVAIYAKTDALLYQKDDTGKESRITPFVAIAKYYNHDQTWVRKTTDNTVVQSPNEILMRIDDNTYILPAQIELDVDTAGDWDTVVGTDYSTPANRAGLDFYVYAMQPASGSVPEFVLSANSTVPDGYTADNSRKVCGFHCLCVAVGTIAGHTLTGYLQGDILPASVWDLYHRPIASPEGMVYSEQAGIWVDIYLASGTGVTTASVNGATISDTRDWMSFVDDFAAVKKKLLDDTEFQIVAAGSNEETNITGSADPVTAGGHVDTASRRMISNVGCEDCCGAMWQWLLDQSYRMDGVDLAASQAWAWENLPGAKGSLHKQGTYGDAKLLAGGDWANGTRCGSRSRYARYCRWDARTAIGGRGRSEPRVKFF